MSDQCKHCSVIFNEKACDSTQCSIHNSTYARRLKATIERLQAKIERLRAIVDKSPKTIVLPKASERSMLNGWKLEWNFLDAIHWKTDMGMEDIESVLLAAQEICSTREAAKAAKEKNQ